MRLRTVTEPAGHHGGDGYAVVLRDVDRLTADLRRAVDAAHHCHPQQQTSMMIDLHNRARGIAARLNRALAARLSIEDSQ